MPGTTLLHSHPRCVHPCLHVRVCRYSQVLYDFAPESNDEVAVYAGEHVRVLHDLGDWLQVTSPRDGLAVIGSSSGAGRYVRLYMAERP